jgi:DNA-binding transcriptional LysR family regulator
MESKWIEDFLALIDEGSFTKAAEKRYVTQPAFSRRIRSLEQWLGVELIDRNSFPIKLTKVGQESQHRFRHLLNEMNDLKKTIRALDSKAGALILSTQASLSVSFCPGWFASLKPIINQHRVRVIAGDLYDCIEQFLSGHSDMLLCYSHGDIMPDLHRADLRHIKIDSDKLIPVCAENLKEQYTLTEQASPQVLNAINFTTESYFGQLIRDHCLVQSGFKHVQLNSIIETSLSESVHAHVLSGAGFAWLPQSLVANDLHRGNVVQLHQLPHLELDVNLFVHDQFKSPKVLNQIWESLTVNLNKTANH